MKQGKAIPVLLLLAALLGCTVWGCKKHKHAHDNRIPAAVHDLPQIKDSGELVVLTLYSSTTYFNYRGQEMGFQYELSTTCR